MTPSALHIAHNAFYAELVIYATSIVHNQDDAQEIAADAFIGIWKQDLETKDDIRRHLFTMARTKAIDRWRANRSRITASVDEFPDGPDENQQIEASVIAKLLEQAQQLPEQCRKVFFLYWMGKKTEEIMKAMGLSRQNVLNQKTRAIKLLRQKLNYQP